MTDMGENSILFLWVWLELGMHWEMKVEVRAENKPRSGHTHQELCMA